MKRNQVLMRLMTWRADILRAKEVKEGSVTHVEYEMVQQEVPCKLSQGIASRVNLAQVTQDDVARMDMTAKGFFDWTADVQAGDRVNIRNSGEEVGTYEVGEVFCYRGSHKECRMRRQAVL